MRGTALALVPNANARLWQNESAFGLAFNFFACSFFSRSEHRVIHPRYLDPDLEPLSLCEASPVRF